ncbi:hypothetical protein R3I94_018529 [Phoxinus phoxinus]
MASFGKAFKISCALITALMIIVYFAGPHALQKRSSDCRCSLPCDGEAELKQLKSVHVLVQHRSDTVLDKTFPGVYDGGRCSVPGCFEKDAKYTLQIYTHDNEKVPKLLYDKPDVQPECDTETPGKRIVAPAGADRNFSNKLLILLTFCCLVFVF